MKNYIEMRSVIIHDTTGFVKCNLETKTEIYKA